MKVAICDPIDERAIEKLKELGLEVFDYSTVDKKELKEYVKDADILIVRSATKVKGELMDSLQSAKLIIRGGVGIDNIDLEAAKAKGIKVVNTPEASSISVAELVFAHLFALLRHIVRGTTGIKEGKWEKKLLKGHEVFGKTLGIIGMGRIGREVAKRAKALGMKVIGHDVVDFPEEFAEKVSLEELYQRSDIITLHVPLIPQTRHMINMDSIEKMKDGVIIINCSRGGVIDENALYNALKKGKVRGAGLDVFENEPPQNSPLFELDNVTFTPHIGASTYEAQARIGEEIVKKVKAFLEGNL